MICPLLRAGKVARRSGKRRPAAPDIIGKFTLNDTGDTSRQTQTKKPALMRCQGHSFISASVPHTQVFYSFKFNFYHHFSYFSCLLSENVRLFVINSGKQGEPETNSLFKMKRLTAAHIYSQIKNTCGQTGEVRANVQADKRRRFTLNRRNSEGSLAQCR